VSRIGWELYEKIFKNYTRKQWGIDPSKLDASVAGRIPLRFNTDDRYFSDTFQAVPKHGFSHLFSRMLDHKNITIRLGVNYRDIKNKYSGLKTIFTGPMDEYFNYKFGPLPYRSLSFIHETHDIKQYQTAAVINYPNEKAYTRIAEFKSITGQLSERTSIALEYPQAQGEPYYPIPQPETAAIFRQYKELADRTSAVYFVGRLAAYRYYNMDQVVAQALSTFNKIVRQRPG
jgi:UDP-galactopyranose mutase